MKPNGTVEAIEIASPSDNPYEKSRELTGKQGIEQVASVSRGRVRIVLIMGEIPDSNALQKITSAKDGQLEATDKPEEEYVYTKGGVITSTKGKKLVILGPGMLAAKIFVGYPKGGPFTWGD